MYLVFTLSIEYVPLVEFMYLVFTLSLEYVPLVEFRYRVFTRMPGESYRRRLRSLLLYLCYNNNNNNSYIALYPVNIYQLVTYFER